jgi:hypothetical protein
VEINPFKEDLGKVKDNQDQGEGKEVESGKVKSSAIKLAIALETNLLCQSILVLVFHNFLLKAQK